MSAQRNDDSFATLWDELEWRGLVHVSTDPEALSELLEGAPFTYYCGFDPTAPSLHHSPRPAQAVGAQLQRLRKQDGYF